MRAPALLLALLLPGCGDGVAGIPVPGPMDMAHIMRPASPNTALAAPAGFMPPPDIVTPVYAVPAAALYEAVRQVAAAQARTFPLTRFDDRMQAHFVARSTVFGFPDLIAVQVEPAAAPGHATLVLYSRSVYGQSDLGVNRRRVNSWLAALDARLADTPSTATPGTGTPDAKTSPAHP